MIYSKGKRQTTKAHAQHDLIFENIYGCVHSTRLEKTMEGNTTKCY